MEASSDVMSEVADDTVGALSGLAMLAIASAEKESWTVAVHLPQERIDTLVELARALGLTAESGGKEDAGWINLQAPGVGYSRVTLFAKS